MGEDDDIGTSNWSRLVVVLALLSGAGSGASWLTTDTSDRYHAAQAAADFAIRDRRIEQNRDALGRHLQSAEGHIERINNMEFLILELRERVRELEIELAGMRGD